MGLALPLQVQFRRFTLVLNRLNLRARMVLARFGTKRKVRR